MGFFNKLLSLLLVESRLVKSGWQHLLFLLPHLPPLPHWLLLEVFSRRIPLSLMTWNSEGSSGRTLPAEASEDPSEFHVIKLSRQNQSLVLLDFAAVDIADYFLQHFYI